METGPLKRFAQQARRDLMSQVRSRLDFILTGDTTLHREQAKTIEELRQEISHSSAEAIVERVAYLWFNRFIALRFMDVNRYTFTGIVSPRQGHTQPEILQEAKEGHVHERLELYLKGCDIQGILSGRAHSRDPQLDAYRMLIVAACNYYYSLMPFMFEEIDHYSELLMPEDLLSEASILQNIREVLTEETCRDVEVIGWLYQFYISEKKDQVFEGLKSNKKITPENIPAATQLFTPHWIVRYLVENSLGRLWLLNHPGSSLKEHMEYYIEPVDEETDFLVVDSPEEIRLCDPACGSGHMLTYAFDLLFLIYEEEGYNRNDIPSLILKNNLYGMEIDERAGGLAAFALCIKALDRDRRFLEKKLGPNILVYENIAFARGELNQYMDEVGSNLFTLPLQNTLTQFEEAKTFGSLIRPDVTDVAGIRKTLEEREMGSKLLLHHTHLKVLRVLNQAEYLSPRYHVVVANPPYMRIGSMNISLRNFVQNNYPISKPDMYSIFIERNLELIIRSGLVGMITMQSWMFLTSFEKFRVNILKNNTIISMIHLGARAFDTIGGEVVSTTAFVINNKYCAEYRGSFLRLVSGSSETEKQNDFRKMLIQPFIVSSEDFEKIPGYPIGYWITERVRSLFAKSRLNEILLSEGAVKTGDNSSFLRYQWEISKDKVSKNGKWRKHPKGGEYRKWYGNLEWVVDWSDSARRHYKEDFIARIPTKDIWDIEGITWTSIASEKPSFRVLVEDEIANNSALFVYPKNPKDLLVSICCLNSNSARLFLNILNPTIQYLVGDILNTPKPEIDFNLPSLVGIGKVALLKEKDDWDSSEISWEFTCFPLLNPDYSMPTLRGIYQKLRTYWQEMTLEMQRLEEENNRIFIEAYGLQDELTPEVPLEEITLTCNPVYRYGPGKSDEEYERLLKADTMKEFMSYAVGCMFGRYSLDKPGLVLANAGETLEDYLQQVPKPTFMPDNDNVIPLLEGDWFTDDVTERFRLFLKVTFGEEHYDENLAFIEDAIGKDIRSYFVKDFYNDHVKRYKKRPIYWLFSSPKGSFNVLIYLHRYRPDTVSVVLNDYLREFRTKLMGRKQYLEHIESSATASQADKTRAIKELDKIKKTIDEVDEYEREILYPLASQKIELDLDDGVKVNYPKLGRALKPIKGLEE